MSTAYIVWIIFLLLFLVLSICQIGSSIGMLVNYMSLFHTYSTNYSSSTCRQEISSHQRIQALTSEQQNEAKRFCRDNEILAAAGSLGILAGSFILASAVPVYFRKLRITTSSLLAIAFLLSMISFVIPFGMRDSPEEEDIDLCSAATNVSSHDTYVRTTKEDFVVVHGLYTCWKGGIHNFHNMSTEARVNNDEKQHMFASAVIFLFFAFVSMCVTPPAAATLLFYDLRIMNTKPKISLPSFYTGDSTTVADSIVPVNVEVQTDLQIKISPRIQVSASTSRIKRP